MKRKLCFFLLAALGFQTACESEKLIADRTDHRNEESGRSDDGEEENADNGGYAPEDEEENRVPCMYGTPNIDISVAGRVTDTEGNPVCGIEVACDEGVLDGRRRAYTDGEGRFLYTNNIIPNSVKLRFSDIDGEENGGEFQTELVEVTFSEEHKTAEGDDGWNSGTYSRTDIDVVLDGKE